MPVPESKAAPAPVPAPAAAAAAAAAAVEEEAEPSADDPRLLKFAMQVQILSSMGFRRRGALLRLLEKNAGDVTATYNDLVAAILNGPDV